MKQSLNYSTLVFVGVFAFTATSYANPSSSGKKADCKVATAEAASNIWPKFERDGPMPTTAPIAKNDALVNVQPEDWNILVQIPSTYSTHRTVTFYTALASSKASRSDPCSLGATYLVRITGYGGADMVVVGPLKKSELDSN